jgi:hypothetical protein
MHLAAAAWHVARGEGACVPWAIVVGGILRDRLAGVGGTEWQGDCRLWLLDWGEQTSRERTFDRLSPGEEWCMYSRGGRGGNFLDGLEGSANSQVSGICTGR